MSNEKEIHVYADWSADSNKEKGPSLLGSLYAQQTRGREVFSFEYNRPWLTQNPHCQLDPQLQLFPGRQFALSDRPSFGLFTDSAPDRWGRLLMQRREAILARHEARPVKPLMESDYLLGVYDLARQGGLRFKTATNRPFAAADTGLATPPWARMRELEAAVAGFENAENMQQEEQFLKLLLAPGSSLGGARPKACVSAEDGSLWLAKFPAKYDVNDVGAWEFVVHALAREAGIDVSQSRLERYSDRGSVFLVRRFDRDNKMKRIHFASAMTLLCKTDGASSHDGSSYLELAQLLRQSGVRAKDDLAQLWRRIVFSIAVSNTDDHLRNHGFLLHREGWALSPAYDINPNPQGSGLSLNISEADNSLSFELAMEQAAFFGLSAHAAKSILSEVTSAVATWPEHASRVGIRRQSQQWMATAFRSYQPG